MSLSGMVSALLLSPGLPSWLSESDFSVECFPDPPTKLSALLHLLVGHIQTRCMENEKLSEVSQGVLEGNIYLFQEYFSKYNA